MATKKSTNGMSVKAYRGDAKTLLAFNLPKAKTKNLAGFTIKVTPQGKEPFFLQNQLRFEDSSKHALDLKLPLNSSFNAPIHKFRWLHVPGSLQQGIAVEVVPFVKGKVSLGFTRGFTQSQAFVHHFGPKAIFRPKNKDLLFDTSQVSGTDNEGKQYTFAEEYGWLGFTARDRILFAL